MSIRVLDWKWRSCGAETVGVVLCEDEVTKKQVAYIGVCQKDNSEYADVEYIKNWGGRLSEDEAIAFFGKDVNSYRDS